MGQEDIACMKMLNCFLDTSLKAKLGAVKNPTLAVFNGIIESHEAGKKAANINASVNSIKGKGDIGRNICQQLRNGKRDQISNAERERCKKISGKCFRCAKSDHLMQDCKISPSIKCNSCNNSGHISPACDKDQNARTTQKAQDNENTSYSVEYPALDTSFFQLPMLNPGQSSTSTLLTLGAPCQAWS